MIRDEPVCFDIAFGPTRNRQNSDLGANLSKTLRPPKPPDCSKDAAARFSGPPPRLWACGVTVGYNVKLKSMALHGFEHGEDRNVDDRTFHFL